MRGGKLPLYLAYLEGNNVAIPDQANFILDSLSSREFKARRKNVYGVEHSSAATKPRGQGPRNSFSGSDITAYISIPPAPGTPFSKTETVQGVLGTLQTISYSMHREVVPVRALGKSRAHAYTRGPRTIAGSMVWTTMDQYVLAAALEHYHGPALDTSTVLADQLPPIDVVITFANEWPGEYSKMVITGIRMVNEGSTLSIDDMITEQTNTYVATDIDLMHRGKPYRVYKDGQFPRSADDMMRADSMKRISQHRSPFV
jgi:hypothetical protein